MQVIHRRTAGPGSDIPAGGTCLQTQGNSSHGFGTFSRELSPPGTDGVLQAFCPFSQPPPVTRLLGGGGRGRESLPRTRTPSRTVGGRVPSNPLRAGLEARHRARTRALLGRRTRRRGGERGRAGADGVGVRRPSALPWWSGTGRGPPSGWRYV